MSSVGKILRTEREKQGITLQEISDATNIKKKYLEDVENDDYDSIPGTVFVKGFIRNYGNFLALDGTALVEMYKSSVEVRVPRPEVRTVATVKKSKVAAEAVHKKTRQGKWPEILIIAGIVIFFLLILWIMM
ncbi:MAG: helix-turn-helix domain-containing protein [Megasphaera sp.]|nr:helix-turn-helix domain-containing protein [Megasphaera sp.]MCI1248058.1 helix-turn-helix domain-containing protein [Megasphaera sp.]